MFLEQRETPGGHKFGCAVGVLELGGAETSPWKRCSRGSSGACPRLKQVGWEAKLGREGERAGARGGTGAWAASLQVRSEEAGQQGAA